MTTQVSSKKAYSSLTKWKHLLISYYERNLKANHPKKNDGDGGNSNAFDLFDK